MKLVKKLNSRGIAHYFIPLAVMVVVAVGGAAALVGSHADPASKKAPKAKTGTVVVRVVVARCKNKVQPFDLACQYVNSKDNLLVYVPTAVTDTAGPQRGSKCNNITLDPSGGQSSVLGTVRTIKCTPGSYDFKAERATAYTYKIDAPTIGSVDLKAGHTVHVTIGSSFDLNH